MRRTIAPALVSSVIGMWGSIRNRAVAVPVATEIGRSPVLTAGQSTTWRGTILLWILAATQLDCLHTTTVSGVCGDPPNQSVCLGAMTVPRGQEAKVTEGARLAIVAVTSPDFESRLADFITTHGRDTKIERTWRNLTAAEIVKRERASFTPKMGMTTWKGAHAWLSKVFSHNIALEGSTDDAGNRQMEVNAWALPAQTASDIANTFAHEVGHAAGLTHPDSDTNLPRAMCEPPYVVGTLVKQIADGPTWTWDGRVDCACLRPGADQTTCVP